MFFKGKHEAARMELRFINKTGNRHFDKPSYTYTIYIYIHTQYIYIYIHIHNIYIYIYISRLKPFSRTQLDWTSDGFARISLSVITWTLYGKLPGIPILICVRPFVHSVIQNPSWTACILALLVGWLLKTIGFSPRFPKILQTRRHLWLLNMATKFHGIPVFDHPKLGVPHSWMVYFMEIHL